LLAALVLAAIEGRTLWQNVAGMPRAQRLGIALAGVLLAAHFGLFVWGLQQTSLPAAVSLVSLEPLAVVLAAWLLHGVRPRPLEQAGVAVATLGALVMSRGAGTGEHRLFGDLLVIAAVLLYGLYIAAARSYRRELSARSYAALVYGAAALATAIVVALSPPSWPPPLHSSVAVVGLALVPTVIGHTAVQAAAKIASPSLVALVSPMETLGSLVLGALWLSAWPSGVELAGAAVIVLGVMLGVSAVR
jgi:drug/metabolite transporter (DMT)-like permease